jgi:peptidyl-prolyl cis-trans isomerase-like 3
MLMLMLHIVCTVFGRVIDGFDTLSLIEKTPVDAKHRPLTDVQLKGVLIHANPLADRMMVYPTATGPAESQ